MKDDLHFVTELTRLVGMVSASHNYLSAELSSKLILNMCIYVTKTATGIKADGNPG